MPLEAQWLKLEGRRVRYRRQILSWRLTRTLVDSNMLHLQNTLAAEPRDVVDSDGYTEEADCAGELESLEHAGNDGLDVGSPNSGLNSKHGIPDSRGDAMLGHNGNSNTFAHDLFTWAFSDTSTNDADQGIGSHIALETATYMNNDGDADGIDRKVKMGSERNSDSSPPLKAERSSSSCTTRKRAANQIDVEPSTANRIHQNVILMASDKTPSADEVARDVTDVDQDNKPGTDVTPCDDIGLQKAESLIEHLEHFTENVPTAVCQDDGMRKRLIEACRKLVFNIA